jgi:hypothetical protein
MQEENEAVRRCLPNLFIPGFAKAGTTSLASALSDHPSVYVPYSKEPHFFSNDTLWSEGLRRYVERHYRHAESFPIRVDATPHYLFYPKAAKRIADTIPEQDQRFIVMLRDPVARAYSLYWNMRHEGHELLSFEDAIKAEEERTRVHGSAVASLGNLRFQYVASSLYASQLEAWFSHLPRARFLYVLMEDIESDPSLVMREVLGFIDLGMSQQLSIRRRNESASPRSVRFQRWIRSPSPRLRPLGRMLPAAWKARFVASLLKLNRRRRSYERISPSTEYALRERFCGDLRELERITGRDLRMWMREKAQREAKDE